MEDVVSASLLDHYNRLASSFALGLRRLTEARIVALTTVIALHKFNLHQKDSRDPGSFEDVLDELKKISFSEYDSFHYVSDASYLVYATTLVDTFLTDTTRFLLLLHPGSIGENHAVSLKALLAAESKNDLINEAATRRAREIGYLPFLARLEFLRRQYGLTISLDSQTEEDLEHYSSVRNVIVHDQAVYDVRLDSKGAMDAVKKTCPRHPTPLRQEQLQAALAAYRMVVATVYRAVVSQVLKGGVDPKFSALLAAFDRAATGAVGGSTDERTGEAGASL